VGFEPTFIGTPGFLGLARLPFRHSTIINLTSVITLCVHTNQVTIQGGEIVLGHSTAFHNLLASGGERSASSIVSKIGSPKG